MGTVKSVMGGPWGGCCAGGWAGLTGGPAAPWALGLAQLAWLEKKKRSFEIH